MSFKDPLIQDHTTKHKLVPMKYVDDDGTPTDVYPFNPNGSVGGIAGVCSENGRHLAIMPHPERCFQSWQWPWMPTNWNKEDKSPWCRMFENAYAWCYSNSERF